jgi:hypothetical protein
MKKPRIRKRRDGIVEIRRAVRPGAGSGSRVRDALRAALLVICGALFFAASLAGHLFVAVMGVAAVRLAWGTFPRRGPAAPAATSITGARLRLVSAADDAA